MPLESSPPQAVLSTPTGNLTVSLTDARGMRDALRQHLATAGDLQPPVPREVGEAWIDPQGAVRMGPWLLEARASGPVLTYRQPSPQTPVSYRYVAHLERTKAGWMVTALTMDQIMPRR